MEIIGYILALVMGATLGLFGGGGSLLAVPILVYFFDVPVVEATAYSLIIVGLAATMGTVQKHRDRSIRWDVVLKLAVSSLLAVYVTRRYILPAIPERITLGAISADKDILILILFCFLMFLAAFSMLRPMAKEMDEKQKNFSLLLLSVWGTVLGVITGIVGAGGGFLMVPVLVIFMGLNMRMAVGTSLAIVAIKSIIGFLGDIGAGLQMNWPLLAGVLGVGLIGLFAGLVLSKKVNAYALKRAFGFFILVMAVVILYKELL